MKKIKLNKEISIDIPKLIEGGMVILANSGGGKSYAIRKIAEEAVDQVQTIIIDPEGEFASLREKYDFILAGKNADVPVETRSAALLATRLLELGKSAVIDLYELHPSERQRYVKLFCDAMVNCPKELYHPVIIILDEAHEYVPEGKPSEATWAVESLASKGRKRGQRLILASQRISKLSKNASAECNNKLIGRASQDIDMKRAGDELGFNKEKLKELRQLKPGEFFAFGPAISDEVIKVKIGEVKTEHAKVGYKNANKVPPPSHVIKKILGELADLPHEAEKEAKTVAELKKENADLKRMNTSLLKHPFQKDETYNEGIEQGKEMMSKVLRQASLEWEKQAKEILGHYNGLYHSLKSILKEVKIPEELRTTPMGWMTPSNLEPVVNVFKNTYKHIVNPSSVDFIDEKGFIKKGSINIRMKENGSLEVKGFGKCARAIYSYLVLRQGTGMTKTQVAVATGYSQNSGGFNNAISELASQSLIMRGHNLLNLQGPVQNDLLVEIDTSLPKWLPKLGACARKIFEYLLTVSDSSTKDEIAQQTGYSVTSGGFNNSISELSSLGLIERQNGTIRINPEILDL